MSSNPHILVVEDDSNDAFLVKRFFDRNTKCVLHFVQDGEEAIEYLEGKSSFADRQIHPLPVLILMDLKMPRRNGFDVLSWLRQQADLRVIPVVIISSSKVPSDIHQAYELGANAYMEKPVNHEAMTRMLKALNVYWMDHCEKPEVKLAGNERA